MKRSTMIPIACSVLLLPSLAHAGNGAHPRTPVDWSSAACMTVVDRSSDGPLVSLEYAIPYEDTDVTQDEVADSRTHQFFVFCRDRHLEDILPGWISEADVMAADLAGLGDANIVDFELEILDNTPIWAGCWQRITADDERRPITFAAASTPVPWDTSTLAPGAYVVDGYTYEPWFNLWTPHPGVFKLVDDPDPAANGPAAALTFGEQTVTYGVDEASITGCVDAMAGSTMTLSWSNGNINGEPNWEVFAADLPVEGASFDVAYAPAIEAVSNSVMIQLEVTDPMGRSWLAYSRQYIAVVEDVGGDESGCDSDGGFVGNPCDDTDTGGAGTSTDAGDTNADTSTSSGPPINADGGGAGCGCASGEPSGGAGIGGLFLLAIFVVRRR